MKINISYVLFLSACIWVSGVSADMIANYELDENTSNSVVSDRTGNGYDGTLFSDSTAANTSTVYSSDSVASGGSFRLNGTSEHIQLPNLEMGTSYSYSITAWVKRDTSSWNYNETIFSNKRVGRQGENITGFYIQHSTVDDNLKLVWDAMTTNWQPRVSTFDIPEDQWIGVAVTSSQTAVKLYKYDPVTEIMQVESFASVDAVDINYGYIGWDQSQTTRHFPGNIDDVRIYNNTLSDSEIEDVLKFKAKPAFAFVPIPQNGATFANTDVQLSWDAGYAAQSHDVYVGLDYDSVNNASRQSGDIDGSGQVNFDDLVIISWQWLQNPADVEPYADLDDDGKINMVDFSAMANDWLIIGDPALKGNQLVTGYLLEDLVDGNTYYWRVDEVNGPDTVKGDVWNFTVAEVLSFDVGNTTGRTFDGFGVVVWAGMAPVTVFDDLNVRYIRMDTAIGAVSKTATTWAATEPRGIEPVFVMYGNNIPIEWCSTDSGHPYLLPEYFDDFAELWGDIVAAFDAADMCPPYIELINELDVWHHKGYVSPENYNILVKMVRAELDSRGFSDVGIVGPGVAHIDHVSPGDYSDLRIDGLDSIGVAAHSAWSTHGWIWNFDEINAEGGQGYLREVYHTFGDSVAAQDPAGEKPIFITEYGTYATTFHGITYPGTSNYDYSVSDTVPYAVRHYEQTLSLINCGVNVPFFWESKDPSWSTLSFGLIDKYGVPRPTFYALKTLCPKIPVGADVLTPPTPQDSPNDIYAAGFVKDGQLVVALVNGTDSERYKNIEIAGIGGDMSITSAVAFKQVDPGDVNECETVDRTLILNSEPSGNYSFYVILPADSTLTVVCDFTTE